MLVSLTWLQEYVPLTLPPKELAERLTLAGAKVEHMVSRGEAWDKVTVAEVLAVNPHPNADRLRLVTLAAGAAEQATVVCGAPNVAAGQKIAFAAVGAQLIDGHSGEPSVLKPARIRGVESAGMVCSERELGISDNHQEILVLAADAPVGTPLKEYLGDTIFDIEVTPNRPDLLSLLGVAWEVGAQTHVRVQEPERTYAETATAGAATRTSVEIRDRDLCARYVAGVVERVRVGPSPAWLQQRLVAAGMRPINNVVDITNYVTLELGQPLHAFDFRKLGGGKIVVRRAEAGETIRTLDGTEHELTQETLVIADATRPVAIAGVMGGAESEVSDATTTILLESASFNPVSVRATSSRVGLRTEASVRFEKGLHPELAVVAARRAMRLLVELTGGRACKGLVDVYPTKRSDTRVVVTRRRVEQVLGVDLNPSQVRTALTDLGFGCRWVPPDRYVVRVPYWRSDVNQPDDVVEDVARVTGYDRIEAVALAGAVPRPLHQPVRELRERLRDAAAAAGLQEVMAYPLTTTDTLRAVASEIDLRFHPPLRLENPMSSEQAELRTSLRGSILATLSHNIRFQAAEVGLFECARVYLPREGDLPEEREHLAAALAGKRLGRWGEPTDDDLDFFDAKGRLEELLERLRLSLSFRPAEEHGLVRGRTAALVAGEEQVGLLGQVHPSTAAAFEIDVPAFLFELDVERLEAALAGQVRHAPLSRFPVAIQDLALLVGAEVPAQKVAAVIESSALVQKAQLFDVYEGGSLPAGKRSLAFAVHFQAPDRTLTEREVADARERLLRRLAHEVGAKLRGG